MRKAGLCAYPVDDDDPRGPGLIQNVAHLLRSRRFVPLFATQFLGAFNDSLFKQAVVLFVTYQLLKDARQEFQFSAIAQGLFILPFFLFSALSGQLADDHDKAKLIRIIKLAEIGIMIVGGAGLMLANKYLMLAAVLAMGVHSTFFGPIKYSILPQHLRRDEVLGGTGLVEAGTYIAILLGTILAGVVASRPDWAAAAVFGFALLGYLAARQVPPAPPAAERLPITWHIVHASIELVSATMHIRRLFLAILAISFFWTIGAVLIIIFPPLVKNVLGANEQVASMFIAIFSIGIAIGSVAINRLLKSEVSARFAPPSVIAMGVFVLLLHFVALAWGKNDPGLTTLGNFLLHP
ncbi:MAG TPA: MFS transporter, partial [Sphingomicrobium sp.]|nr:MFS transporter [Sphingomicrobium sp.]